MKRLFGILIALLICAVILMTFAPAEAALIEKGASVAVMDLGVHMLGLIDPDTAKKLGEILGIRYIVYGNVVDVTVAVGKAGVVVNTVKAHMVIRIMDVETGNILMAAKGEGKSASAFVGDGTAQFIYIGTTKVTQTAVHNALKKAAFQAVDVLNERLFSKNK